MVIHEHALSGNYLLKLFFFLILVCAHYKVKKFWKKFSKPSMHPSIQFLNRHSYQQNITILCTLQIMQILSHHQKTTFGLKRKKAATVYRGAVQLLCGCILHKTRFRYYLHSPYLMASGEESRDTVVCTNTIISETSGHCLRPEIPNPTLLWCLPLPYKAPF